MVPFGESEILKNSPCFYLKGDDISIIRSPSEFFTQLKLLVGNAQDRIYFASLYLGVGKKEDELVSSILESFNRSAKVRGTIVLDYCRAFRGEPNSCTKLLNLKKEFPERFDLALFHSPLLRHVWKKVLPERWNEIIGVQHMKIYVVDDCVIISGANLSNDYFTNRQDRYVLLRNADLADFYVDLIDLVAGLSFHLTPNGTITLYDSCPEHPYRGSYTRFCEILKRDIQCLFERWHSKQQNAMVPSYDTVVYPLVQLGAIGLHTVDRIITQFIFNAEQSDDYDLYLASGYFNPTQAYADALLETSKRCHLLLASCESNGFHGAKGFSRQVPFIYLCYAYDFLNDVARREQQSRVLLSEYARDGWTFHAKGIWLRGVKPDSRCYTVIGSSNFAGTGKNSLPPRSYWYHASILKTGKNLPKVPPAYRPFCGTKPFFILKEESSASPRCRSVLRDLESQLVMITESSSLKSELQNECDSLFTFGKPIENALGSRNYPGVSFFVRLVARLLKSYF